MNRQLLERTGRGVSPTDAGQQLYYYARSILDKFQMLERLSQNGDTQLVSRLRVSVAMLILQDDLMEALYHQLHTQEVELCIFETTLEPLIEQVAGGQFRAGSGGGERSSAAAFYPHEPGPGAGTHFPGPGTGVLRASARLPSPGAVPTDLLPLAV